jgi:hypothetical protein
MSEELTATLNPDARVLSDRTRLKLQMDKVRKLMQKDVSGFKVGSWYEVEGREKTIFLINEIGPHPIDRLPTGYGLIITPTESEPHYLHLYELGKPFG